MALTSTHNGLPSTARGSALIAALLMYAAVLVVQVAGYVATGIAFDDMTFAWVLSAVTLVGTATSFMRRSRPGKPAPWDTSVMVVATVAFVTVLYTMQDYQILLPDSAAGSPARYFGVLICWGTALRSFTLTSTGSMLFACVPTIALIGMSATQISDPSLRTVFMTFVPAAIYLLIRGQSSTGGAADHERRVANGSVLLRSQLQLVALYAVPAFLLATLAYVPVSTITTDLGVSPSLTLPTVARRLNQSSLGGTPMTPQEVRVADGPVELSDAIVMRVRAQEADLWRSATYDRYQGHSWSSTDRDRQLLVASNQRAGVFTYRIPNELISAPGPRTIRVAIFRIEGAGQFSEVYAAAEPRVLMIAHPRVRLNQSGTFHMSYTGGARAYRVESAVPTKDPEYLQAVHGSPPGDIRETYTRLDTMSTTTLQHLRLAAQHACDAADNDYDRVQALKTWIATQCRYNTNTSPAPPDQDVVESFLFTNKEGYCDSFASALAVLCRTIGIPARVATGYISGDFDPERQEYLVRDKHRHMWTEVYFPSAGWIPFDATEGANDASPVATAAAPRARRSFMALLFRRGWLPPVALLCLLGMIGYVLTVEVWDRLRKRRNAVTARTVLPPTNREIMLAYERTCAALARKGLGRGPSNTPHEYQLYASAHLPEAPAVREALARLTLAAVRFRYSAEIATDDDVKAADAAAVSIRAGLRSVRRLRPPEPEHPAPAGA
jgi:transglutaminase-like putative cysteine protease